SRSQGEKSWDQSAAAYGGDGDAGAIEKKEPGQKRSDARGSWHQRPQPPGTKSQRDRCCAFAALESISGGDRGLSHSSGQPRSRLSLGAARHDPAFSRGQQGVGQKNCVYLCGEHPVFQERAAGDAQANRSLASRAGEEAASAREMLRLV